MNEKKREASDGALRRAPERVASSPNISLTYSAMTKSTQVSHKTDTAQIARGAKKRASFHLVSA